MPASQPTPTSPQINNNNNNKCCCFHPFIFFTYRPLTRGLLLAFTLIITGCLISLLIQRQQPSSNYSSSLKDPAVIFLFISALIGLIFNIFWMILETLGKENTVVDCQGSKCYCVNWQLGSDLLIAVVIALCSILALQRSPCSDATFQETFGSWCPLYNTSIAFGIISMPFYLSILFHDFGKCCGGSNRNRRSRNQSNQPVAASSNELNPVQSKPPLPQRESVWPPKE